MAANTGTYLDTPAHRYRDGEDLSVLSLDRMVDLDGVVARVRHRPAAGGRAIDESDLRQRPGRDRTGRPGGADRDRAQRPVGNAPGTSPTIPT